MRSFAVEQGLEFFYGRIFSAYGLGQNEANFWPSLRRAALAGQDFAMTSGQQVSDFVPVQTVTEHLLTACRRADLHPGFPLVVNIGSGVPSTLLNFAQQEWVNFKAKGKLLPGSLSHRLDQVYRYVPDLVGLHPLPDPLSLP